MSIEEIYQLYKECPAVCTDTRNIIKNSMFFALKGANFDGNDYAEDALLKGARFVVAGSARFKNKKNIIVVKDTLKTLQKLATYHRKQYGFRIIGITGSNGKTTTKELINSVLSVKYKTQATKGNLNNHIGVPLTLLSFKPETEFGIVEMGANHIGEISLLCEIAQPDYGIITNIGKAHIEGFGSGEGVIKAKSELYQYISENNGLIFYNNDNVLLQKLVKQYNNKVIGYGNNSDFMQSSYESASPYLNLFIYKDDKSYKIETNLIGSYNFENAVAAACIGKYFNIGLPEIIKQIEDYRPDNMRSQFIETSRNRIILDAYNANPTSMRLAIENFVNLPSKNKILILGDMMELGNISENEHGNIVEYVSELNFDDVILIGNNFSKENNNKKLNFFKNVDEVLTSKILTNITDKTVLLKASRSIGLEILVPYL